MYKIIPPIEIAPRFNNGDYFKNLTIDGKNNIEEILKAQTGRPIEDRLTFFNDNIIEPIFTGENGRNVATNLFKLISGTGNRKEIKKYIFDQFNILKAQIDSKEEYKAKLRCLMTYGKMIDLSRIKISVPGSKKISPIDLTPKGEQVIEFNNCIRELILEYSKKPDCQYLKGFSDFDWHVQSMRQSLLSISESDRKEATEAYVSRIEKHYSFSKTNKYYIGEGTLNFKHFLFDTDHTPAATKEDVFHFLYNSVQEIDYSTYAIDISQHMLIIHVENVIKYLKRIVASTEGIDVDTIDALTVPPDLNSKKNNFDGVLMGDVYKHFFDGFVKTGYMSKGDLLKFIDLAFVEREKPQRRFVLGGVQSKQKIIDVGYQYYKNIASKPYGFQRKYAELIGEYFEGYTTNNVSSNFSKLIKRYESPTKVQRKFNESH
jgi:hypothetical protein